MVTHYAFGCYSVAKDMILGWCFINSDGFVTVEDLSLPALKELVDADFPSYIPEDFKISLQKVLEVKEAEDRRLQKVIADEFKRKHSLDVQPFKKPDRTKCKYELCREVLESILKKEGFYNLDYCLVRYYSNTYSVENREKIECQVFKNLDEALEYIVAKWW